MKIRLTQERLEQMFSKPDISISVSLPDEVIKGVSDADEKINRVLKLAVYAYFKDFVERGNDEHISEIIKIAKAIKDRDSFSKKMRWRYTTVRIPYNTETFIQEIIKEEGVSVNDFIRGCMIHTLSSLPDKKWMEG